jgi:ATP-dependent RNA helicase DDX55/SPB4
MSRAWSDAALSAPILETVAALKFAQMTPVQAATLPAFMAHKDVLVQACTGSGKTLAFIIPALEICMRRDVPLTKHQVGVLMISPTRELALQIHAVAQQFVSRIDSLRLMLFIGGTSVEDGEDEFKRLGANIIVGTPGRLETTIYKLAEFDVRELEVLVLDEADRCVAQRVSFVCVLWLFCFVLSTVFSTHSRS